MSVRRSLLQCLRGGYPVYGLKPDPKMGSGRVRGMARRLAQQLDTGLMRGGAKVLAAPSREQIMTLIKEHYQRFQGPRKAWEVAAAVYVKKMHVDRGDVKVGLQTAGGEFKVIDALRPRYVVPDLTNFELGPYVERYAPLPDAYDGPSTTKRQQWLARSAARAMAVDSSPLR